MLTLVGTSSVYRMRCFDGLPHVGEAAWGAPESFLRLPAREVMSLGRSRDLKRHQIINIGRSSHGRSSALSINTALFSRSFKREAMVPTRSHARFPVLSPNRTGIQKPRRPLKSLRAWWRRKSAGRWMVSQERPSARKSSDATRVATVCKWSR